MRRLIAQLLRLVFPERRPRRSSGAVHWQVQSAAGRHVLAYPRYTPPQPLRKSPLIAVELPRDRWMQIAAILTWGAQDSPSLMHLRTAINCAVAMTRPTAGTDTQWDLDIINSTGMRRD